MLFLRNGAGRRRWQTAYNLKNGQMIVPPECQRVVTGLTIDGDNGQQVLFMRQPDGSFIRA